jgi:hypothetical protein
VFAVSCVAAVFIARVRRGWMLESTWNADAPSGA